MTPQEVLVLHRYGGWLDYQPHHPEYGRISSYIACGCGARLPCNATTSDERRAIHPDHVVAELEAIGMVWQRERASA